MGINVDFHLGAADGLEGLFWGCDLAAFQDWAYEEPEAWKISEDMLLRLDRIVSEGPGSLLPDSAQGANNIDLIFNLFVGSYCDHLSVTILESVAPAVLGRLLFAYAQDEVAARCSDVTSECWQYLLKGRPVGRPPNSYPYSLESTGFQVGYWTVDEVRAVLDDLRRHFPKVVRFEDPRATRGLLDWGAVEIVYVSTLRAFEAGAGLVTTISS